MLDLTPVFKQEITMSEFSASLSKADLYEATNEMVDTIQALIADCVDEDVTFVPIDPDANDTFAANDADANIAWTLGHVIVHTTAGCEEAAFTAAELARGVKNHGRSRYEVPWQSMTTIQQCRDRLEESRRMRLATLNVWPDVPHMDNTMEVGFLPGPINPISSFIIGLGHEGSHLAQIKDIVSQAKAARS